MLTLGIFRGKNFFPVQIKGEGGKTETISLTAPKIKLLKQIMSTLKDIQEATKGKEQEAAAQVEGLDMILEVVIKCLNNNREGRKYGLNTVENLTMEDIQIFLTEYFRWVSKERKEKN